jgi:hypothetical protein
MNRVHFKRRALVTLVGTLLGGAAAQAWAAPQILSITHSGALPGTPTVTAQIQCTSNNVMLTAYYQKQIASGWGPTTYLDKFYCKPPANTGGVITVTKSKTFISVSAGEKFRFMVQQGGAMSTWVVHQF